jgi:hypothetical protein
MCDNTGVPLVRTFDRACEMDMMYYREKRYVLAYPEEMEHCNKSDRSRCYKMCANLFYLDIFNRMYTVHYRHDEEYVEY